MKKSSTTILAIETSCDETAMAVVRSKKTASGWLAQGGSALCEEFEIISNVVASQIDLHKKWGGVYPEMASRAHLEAIIPVLAQALAPLNKNSKIKNPPGGVQPSGRSQNDSLKIREAMRQIDAIAVTEKPGLIGSLLMGLETAEILGSYFKKPIIKVNHLEGHIYASFAGEMPNSKSLISNNNSQDHNPKFTIPKVGIFPVLALVVSGGHTSLILMQDHLKYETVAKTIDDAAGEAFDKVARIIGLPYPGGPEIEKLAKKGDENAYALPIGMDRKTDFSFSGLKTAVLYLTKDPAKNTPKSYDRENLAASFQKVVADTLAQKTAIAVAKYNPKTLILTGGVSANSYIRDHFQDIFSQPTTNNPQPTVLIPPKPLSTDNAVGIGVVGAIRYSSE